MVLIQRSSKADYCWPGGEWFTYDFVVCT